jgi:hypothetical protein
MRAGSPVSTTLALALSTALLVPVVHWCAIPWEQTTLECVARCSAGSGGSCRDAPVASAATACGMRPAGAVEGESGSRCRAADASDAMPCRSGGSCPLARHAPDTGKHGRAYVLGEGPGAVVVRGLAKLVVDLSRLEAPLPSRTPVEIPSRPFARAPDPETRPPTFVWTSVRLARAPPAA